MSTMSSYMSALEKEGRSVNTGMLAGNGTIRAGVKGYASESYQKRRYTRSGMPWRNLWQPESLESALELLMLRNLNMTGVGW